MSTSQRTSSTLTAEKRLDYKVLNETGERVFIEKDNYSQYAERNTSSSANDTSSDSDDNDSNNTDEASVVPSVVDNNLLDAGSTAINEITKLVACHLQTHRMDKEVKVLER